MVLQALSIEVVQSGIQSHAKAILSGCGRLAFFLDYSKCSVACLPLLLPANEWGGRLHLRGNGKLALANAFCLVLFSPEHEVCLLNSLFAMPLP